MKNTKVSKVMLSTLVTGVFIFGSLVASATNEVEAPILTKGETQIELPLSDLALTYELNHQLVKEIMEETERLQQEQEEERLRIELEKAKIAEEARLAKIEAERKAVEEAERKRQAELKQQRDAQKQVQQVQQKQTQSTKGTAYNGSYYTPYCTGCSGITREGHDARKSIYSNGMRVIATDPSVIPMYSIVEVSTPYETFKAIALDTGGAIKGHKIDILVADKKTAYNLGRHTVYVKVLRSGK